MHTQCVQSLDSLIFAPVKRVGWASFEGEQSTTASRTSVQKLVGFANQILRREACGYFSPHRVATRSRGYSAFGLALAGCKDGLAGNLPSGDGHFDGYGLVLC
jgi:hypothetical protein